MTESALKDYIIQNCLHFCADGMGYPKKLKNASFLFDLRELILHPEFGRYAAQLLWQRLKPFNPSYIFGMGAGGTPLMLLVQQEALKDGHHINILICRDTRKQSNRQRIVEGLRPSTISRAFFIDDLTNTGNTYAKCIKALKEDGIQLKILGLSGILDFNSFTGTKKHLADGLNIVYLFRRHALGLTRETPSAKLITRKLFNIASTNENSLMDLKSPPVCDGDNVYWATDAHEVFCANIRTGCLLWHFTAPYSYTNEPKGIVNLIAVNDRYVYFNTYNGFSIKLDKQTGDQIWISKPGRWIHSSTELHPSNDLMYISTESRNFTDTSPSGDFVCMKQSTGEVVWATPANELSPCTPYYWNDIVIVADNSNKLYGLCAYTGKILWKTSLEGSIKGKVAINTNEKCCATTENGWVYIVDPRTGKILYRKLFANGFRHNFVQSHNDNFILLDTDGIVKCIDESITLRWVSRMHGSLGWFPVIHGDQMYCISTTGECILFDIITGKKLKASQLSVTTSSALCICSDRLIVHTTHNGLNIYELTN